MEILHRNSDGAINFKGMMVGNPYVDPFTNDLTQFQTWYDHGLLPWPLYKDYLKFCSNRKSQYTKRCFDYMDMMYDEIGKGINPYGLDYPVCLEKKFDYKGKHKLPESDPLSMADSPANSEYIVVNSDTGEMAVDAQNVPVNNPKVVFSSQATQLMNQAANSYGNVVDKGPRFTPPEDIYLPCQSNHLAAYMNQPEVVEALHANIETLPWIECSKKIDYSLDDNLTPQVNLYADLLKMMKEHPFDMLIFSGDDDSICSLAGTQGTCHGKSLW